MFIAQYRRTMAGVKAVAVDTPIDLKRKPTVKKALPAPPQRRVIIRMEDVLRWRDERKAEEERQRQAEIVVDKNGKKRRRRRTYAKLREAAISKLAARELDLLFLREIEETKRMEESNYRLRYLVRRLPDLSYTPGSIDIAPKASARKLISQVAAWHGISIEEVLGPSREHRVIPARYDAIAAVRASHCLPDWQGDAEIAALVASGQHKTSFTGYMSTPQLERIFNRDHTTILNALWVLGLVDLPSRNKQRRRRPLVVHHASTEVP